MSTEEEDIITTIQTLGAIAGKCKPEEVRIATSIEDANATARLISPRRYRPAIFSRCIVEAGRVTVDVTGRSAVDFGGPTILRDAVKCLARVVSRKAPKAYASAVDISVGGPMRETFKFRMGR
jgi:hypothetical protein